MKASWMNNDGSLSSQVNKQGAITKLLGKVLSCDNIYQL